MLMFQAIPYENVSIGVPKETFLGERRVAISPKAVQQLTKKGFKVFIESGKCSFLILL